MLRRSLDVFLAALAAVICLSCPAPAQVANVYREDGATPQSQSNRSYRFHHGALSVVLQHSPELKSNTAAAQSLLPPGWFAYPPVEYRSIGTSPSVFAPTAATPDSTISPPYTPAEIQGAYGVSALTPSNQGAGVTVAIVDAYGDMTENSNSTITDNNEPRRSKLRGI